MSTPSQNPYAAEQQSSPHVSGSKLYRNGTLQYTFRSLTVLFLWLLWGDFAFSFFENVLGRFIPLYLRELHASNSLIGIMTGTLSGTVNILFLPIISQWSDNFRSRWGRRIPFLYVVTPFVVAALICVGFAPEIADAFFRLVLSRLAPGLSEATVVLVVLCAFMVSFHFFNMVLVNAYNWLLRDVVPQSLMARFLSWFRIIGSISGGLFLWLVFPYILSHRREVCLGIGIFYLISFLLMCHNVNEGEYPPPPPAANRPGLIKNFALYFRECLTIPFYRDFFITYVTAMLATNCMFSFVMLFTRETLGLTMEDMGKVFAAAAVVSAIGYFPLGWMCDKFSPIYVAFAALAGQIVNAVTFFTVVDGKTSYLICSLIFNIPAIAWNLSSQAMAMKFFPKEKFGQFSSGLNVFGCGTLIFGNFFVGKFMDLMHSNYRMIYVWMGGFMTAALLMMLRVYKGWKQHGGPDRYIAPLPTSSGVAKD